MESSGYNYSAWSNESLIERVNSLEKQLKELNTKYTSTSTILPKSSPTPIRRRNPRVDREFDPSKYSTRLIALKFAYLGQRYNGFEHHVNNKTPLPTIEEELNKALNKARLIFPTKALSVAAEEVNWEGCEYSKCGRTDRGVSAFGQVIGIRVRSNCPLSRRPSVSMQAGEAQTNISEAEVTSSPISQYIEGTSHTLPLDDASTNNSPPFHPIYDEIPYPQILNRLLPPDIRILAWCPSPPPDFSARFSCRERRYRYFFTQPAFNPTFGNNNSSTDIGYGPSSSPPRGEGWLNIEAMKDGAKRFEGLHDFRNFCKVDPSKQIDNFSRRIFLSEIREVDSSSESAAYVSGLGISASAHSFATDAYPQTPPINDATHTPKLYTFTLHGSAFLWHQVRHMVAILFLIGQSLESPSLITSLLDTTQTPRKPMYEMAEDAPLVLWDCIFPAEGSTTREDSLKWVYTDSQSGKAASASTSSCVPPKGKFDVGGVVDDLWRVWHEKKMDELLAGQLLNVVARQGSPAVSQNALSSVPENERTPQKKASQCVFYGGNSTRSVGRYVPVLERPRLEAVEEINRKYAVRKGFEQSKEVREGGWRQVTIEGRNDHQTMEASAED